MDWPDDSDDEGDGGERKRRRQQPKQDAGETPSLGEETAPPAAEEPKRLMVAERPLSAASSPLLTELTVHGLLKNKFTHHDIVLPRDWARKFVPDSIKVMGGDREESSYYIGRAHLASDPTQAVDFAARRTEAPETLRELHMARLLKGTGAVPALLDSQVYPEVTFILTEAAGGKSLAGLIEDAEIKPDRKGGDPVIPAAASLKLMSGLLRGLQALEQLDVVHGGLGEEEIFVVDGQPVFTNLRATCLDDSTDALLGCAASASEFGGSAFRHAPEMTSDHPSGMSNNVWRLGLVFARMLLGGDVVTSRTFSLFPAGGPEESTPEGRANIRRIVRKYFRLDESPGYEDLRRAHADLAGILDGMLHKDPVERWSVSRASRAMEKAAADRGITLPSLPRRPQALPSDWLGDWQ